MGGCVTLTRSRAVADEGKAPGCGGVWWSVCWVESGLKEYAPQEKNRKKLTAKKYTKNRKKEGLCKLKVSKIPGETPEQKMENV